MGNKQSESTLKFNKMIAEMKNENHLKVNIHPEKKYLMLMMQQIAKAKIPNTLKQMAVECLTDKLSNAELIQSISSINVLKNNDFQITHSKGSLYIKEKPQSKFVKINFGLDFLSKMLHKIGIKVNEKGYYQSHENLQQINQHQRSVESQQSKIEEKQKKKNSKHKKDDREIRQKLKTISSVMKKQLNRISHPFGKLNKTFAQYIHQYCQTFLNKAQTEDQYQKILRDIISQWCSYLQCSCLNPYKKWIISYSGIQQAKYAKWIRGLVIQQIWAVNNGYLFSMLAIVINSRKIKLKIDFNQLQYNAALLTPTLFSIDAKLQIQGHFFDSIYEMSQVVSKVRPEQIISQLQTVKKRVCTDIDNYHRLNQRGQIYEIDSDNILGIVSYILCKISSRIDQINTCLIFLRIIYGDNIYFSMGISSYMLSTIFGAIEFLQSQQFRQMIHLSNNKVSQVLEDTHLTNKSQTKGTISQKQQIFDKTAQQSLTNKELLSSSMLIIPKHQNISNI